jgi:hypothetical protein
MLLFLDLLPQHLLVLLLFPASVATKHTPMLQRGTKEVQDVAIKQCTLPISKTEQRQRIRQAAEHKFDKK